MSGAAACLVLTAQYPGTVLSTAELTFSASQVFLLLVVKANLAKVHAAKLPKPGHCLLI